MTTLTQEEVEKALAIARIELNKHGGDVELIAINAVGVVLVRLMGVCSSCKGAKNTLHNIIEKILMEKLQVVTSVQAIL